MAEEAKSIPWLKVFGGVGLSGIWGEVKSRVEVGTKYLYRCVETGDPQIANAKNGSPDGNSK